jgi:hypothetical protein
MTNLIDRYVWAVATNLPQGMRDDVARELRATIADMTDDRAGTMPDPTREVLEELGDPVLLARSYDGTTRYLIGPPFYDIYVKLLRTLSAVVLPLVLVANLVVELWDPDRPVMPGIMDAVGHTAMAAMHIFVWSTLSFVVLERSGLSGEELTGHKDRGWGPDQLPEVPTVRQISLGDTLVGVCLLVASMAWLPWQHFRSPFERDGEPVPLLAPDLWSFWIPVFVALLAVNIAMDVWAHRVGRWTLAVTVSNTVLNLVFIAFFVALFGTQQVLNPDFAAAMRSAGNDWDGDVIGMLVLFGALTVCVWDGVDGIRKHLRVRHGYAG